jgi:hypothetical protein
MAAGKVAAKVLLVLAAVVMIAALSFDLIVEKAIETFGPVLTGTSVELEDVELSVFDGEGAVRGLVIGNPAGFETKYAFRVRDASVHLVPRSVFQEKIVIRSIRIKSSDVNFEAKDATSNLEQIVVHIEKRLGAGGESEDGAEAPSADDAQALWTQLTEQKIQLDHFVMSDAQIHASGGAIGKMKPDMPPLDIELQGLGEGENAASVADVTAKVLRRVTSKTSAMVAARALTLGIAGKKGGDEEAASSDDDDTAEPEGADADESRRQRRKHRRAKDAETATSDD